MSHDLYKQLLHDRQSGLFLGQDGQWTQDENCALNCRSVSRIIQLRLEHADRELELVLKSPCETDRVIAL